MSQTQRVEKALHDALHVRASSMTTPEAVEAADQRLLRALDGAVITIASLDVGSEDWNDENAHRRGKECIGCGYPTLRAGGHAPWCPARDVVARVVAHLDRHR